MSEEIIDTLKSVGVGLPVLAALAGVGVLISLLPAIAKTILVAIVLVVGAVFAIFAVSWMVGTAIRCAIEEYRDGL